MLVRPCSLGKIGEAHLNLYGFWVLDRHTKQSTNYEQKCKTQVLRSCHTTLCQPIAKLLVAESSETPGQLLNKTQTNQTKLPLMSCSKSLRPRSGTHRAGVSPIPPTRTRTLSEPQTELGCTPEGIKVTHGILANGLRHSYQFHARQASNRVSCSISIERCRRFLVQLAA